MGTIKNIHKLAFWVDDDVIQKLESGAKLHQRHSNISFKIISADNLGLVIRTEQQKHLSENYADEVRLIDITRLLFGIIPGDPTIRVHPIPFAPAQPDVVNAKWINDHMLKYQVKVKDIQLATGIDKTSISAWINDKKPMSQIVKALMFNFFKVYAIKDLFDVLTDKNYMGFYFIKNYFDRDLIDKMVECSVHKDIIVSERGNELQFSINTKKV